MIEYKILCFYFQFTDENVYDVLCAADLYLLTGLKRLCAGVMSRYIKVNNVINVLRTARLFSLARLESQCAAYMSNHLEEVCPHFLTLETSPHNPL